MCHAREMALSTGLTGPLSLLPLGLWVPLKKKGQHPNVEGGGKIGMCAISGVHVR